MSFTRKIVISALCYAAAMQAGVTIRITQNCLPSNAGVAAASSVISILSNEISVFENIVFSQIEALSALDTICTATTVGTQSTINTAGIYCLSADVSGLITIAASNVTFNLNGHTITGGISVSPNVTNAVIYNGNIKTGSSGNGILIQSGCSALEVNGVEITGATYGIQAVSASNCIIKNCLVRENSYGIYCSGCSGMQIQNTQADSNTNVGFDLVSSSSNVLTDCAALATGKGNNTTSNNTVIGFSSSSGYGNIFERCIANGTQGLLTTDSSSIIAGFALLGTGTQCNKIINCESANAIASASGVTIPYGILLQGSLNTVLPVTGTFSSSNSSGPYTCSWSPDGQYLAVGGSSLTGGNELQIFSFNRINGSLTLLTGAVPSATQQVRVSKWSPNGQFIATGSVEVGVGSFWVQVYQFNRQNNSLQLVAQAIQSSELTTGGCLGIDWSPDGSFIAIGIITTVTGHSTGLAVLQFNDVTYQLSLFASSLISGTGVQGYNASQWSPDGNYIVVSGTGFANNVQVFQFNRSAATITFVQGISTSGDGRSAIWSPDGNYIAYGTTSGNILYVYKFNRLTNQLTLAQTASGTNGQNWWTRWSPDGKYIASVGANYTNNGGNQFQVWQFDRSLNTLTYITGAIPTVTNFMQSVDWSPDGTYMVVGGLGLTSGLGTDLQLFTGINFPSQNVISGNTVYCNGQSVSSQFTGAVGVGISGSSISNMIIGNTAYNNPPVSSNFFVGSNYIFVTNVFNQLFGEAPSELQNISLNGNTPITQFTDPVVIAQQIYADLTATSGLLSYLPTLQNQLSLVDTCVPQTLSAAGTISQSGTYCLSKSITGTITIAANDVVLSLNNYKVVGSIVVNNNQTDVTIENGVVDANGGTNGILVNSGASNITISSMTVKNATLGVQFNSVAGATVQSCTFLSNTTGMQLQSSSNVSVFSSNAVHNKDAGFDLLSSTTNSFFDCQALATGQGNTTVTNNFAAGFTSYNGYGNIFERCIANGTQALSTTDSSSVVAGFALRGTEGCTKIINSESANAITSSSGLTIPYGILLQGSLSSIAAVTGALPQASNTSVNAVNWSPDGNYVAVGGNGLTSGSATQVQIYSFNRVNGSVMMVAGVLSSGTVSSVNWSPDGFYLAVAGSSISSGLGNDLQIFQFNRANNTLTAVAGFFSTSDVLLTVNWSPNGQYLAIGGRNIASGLGDDFQILSFNRVTNALAVVAGAYPFGSNNQVNQVNWTQDGSYIVVGGNNLATGNNLQIFSFNGTSIASVTGIFTSTQDVLSVNWSPDNNYIAVGGFNLLSVGTDTNLQIFRFNRTSGALVPLVGFITNASTHIFSVNWSPDGQYLALGGNTITQGFGSNQLQIFSFNRASSILTALAGGLTTGSVLSVNWSPDGQYIVAGGTGLTSSFGFNVELFTALQFPSQNVISGNTVYCNGQSVSTTFTGAVGVGISGSSISNMIIGNTAYDNPPVSSNFFVPSNYYFVTNVFNPLFGQAPSSIQNISLNGNTPITQITDTVWLLQQLQADLYSITNVLATFNNAASLICAPTPVTAAKTLSTAGVYCLSTNITGLITIAASNITLDLNGYTITGGVAVNSGITNVTMKNGRVLNGSGGDGILVNAGAAQITVQDVRVKSATRGIHFTGVSNSYISNCQVSLNTTGIQLQSSSNIEIGDTIATQNVQAGFELLNSATCFIYGSKAMQTGTGNTNSSGNQSFVYGFVANNTVNTVFKDCIADNTKNTSATSWQTQVAGFALLGTGTQCNAIIGCESANGQTSSSGTSVPYGILLQGSTLSQVSTVTGTFSTSVSSSSVNGLAWSPNGQYLAVSGAALADGATNQLQIFSFDRNSGTLTRLAGALPSATQSVPMCKWSPNGQFIAVCRAGSIPIGSFWMQVYRFYSQNNSLQLVAQGEQVTTNTTFGAFSIDWSPDGRFIAVGEVATGNGTSVLQFNDVTYQLSLFARTSSGSLNATNWSPDGNYIAISGNGLSPTDFLILQFNRSANTLTTVASGTLGSSGNGTSTAWSPDGNYIAGTASSSPILTVFSFNKKTNQLTSLQSVASGGSPFASRAIWSPDGRYIALVGTSLVNNGTNLFQIFQYDRTLNTLTLVVGTLSSAGASGITAVAWSPDGAYIAIGGGTSLTSGTGTELQIYTGLSFPSGNVITNNTVYCNSMTFPSAVNPYGTGISGSSILNQIIQNDSFNNAANYVFAQNVFNPVYLGGPTLMQNDSVSQNVPLPQVQSINAALTRARLYLYSVVDSRL